MAESLFGYIDPIGETITYNGYTLTVVGVYYAKDGTAEDSMDDAIVVPYTLNRRYWHGHRNNFTIKVETSDDMEGNERIEAGSPKTWTATQVSTAWKTATTR